MICNRKNKKFKSIIEVKKILFVDCQQPKCKKIDKMPKMFKKYTIL